jgi:hypothetical protein
VIEIEQMNTRVREVAGVMICRYKELSQMQQEQMAQRSGVAPSPQELYPHTVDGGTIQFADSPFPRQMSFGGTGKVAYILDDEMETPEGSLSGATKGWNREFLASHYNDGFWRICDEEVDREVRARSEAIASKRKAMGFAKYNPGLAMPTTRRDPTLVTDPDPGVSVPMQGGEPMVDTQATGEGFIDGIGTVAVQVPGQDIASLKDLVEKQSNTIELLEQRLKELEKPQKKTVSKKVKGRVSPPGVEGGIGE